MSLSIHSLSHIFPFLQKIVWIFLLICFSAFFAGTETSLFSLSRAQLESWVHANDAKGKRISGLLEKPRRLLTTLILGNEIVNISLSALVTGMVSQLLPSLKPAWIGLLATLCTVPILILLGEFLPKTIAMRFSAPWARIVAGPMMVISWILWIPRTMIGAISGAIVFLLSRKSPSTEEPKGLHEHELRTLIDLGNAEGEIQPTEQKMIHSVFDFGDLTVQQIMTPSSNIFSLSLDMPLPRLVEKVSQKHYARVPVYRGKPENIVGILFAKDLVGYHHGDLQGHSITDLLHPPFFIPKRAKCERLFREFQRRKIHMAFIVDEYGKLAGLATMDDLLLALFGNVTEVGVEKSESAKEEQPQ